MVIIVTTLTGWTVWGLNPIRNKGHLSSPIRPNRLRCSSIRLFSKGLKDQGRDVDHSPPTSAEFKKEWSYTSAPYICLYGVDRDNFTLYHFDLKSYFETPCFVSFTS